MPEAGTECSCSDVLTGALYVYINRCATTGQAAAVFGYLLIPMKQLSFETLQHSQLIKICDNILPSKFLTRWLP